MRHVLPVIAIGAIAVASLATRAMAQDTTTTPAPAQPPTGPRCNGETISMVTVARAEPVMVERSAGWARPILRFALAGAPTRVSAVEPFLLVKQGQTCTELLLAESERVLRQQPYLADARATVEADANGTVQVHFSTTDDIRPILGLGVKDNKPTRLKLGSGNVAGYGMLGSIQWQQGFAFRDGFGAKYINYHTFGRPVLFDTQLERTPLGEIVSASLSRPLYSQIQNIAWSATVAHVSRYQRFIRGGELDPLSLDVDRRSWELNAVYRLGGGRNGVFAGASVAGDRIEPDEQGVIITDTGFVADPDSTLGPRYASQTRAAVAAILGARALRFFKAEGFDALEGAQDVAEGLQFGGIFGRGVGRDNKGWMGGTQLYAGTGNPRSFVGMHVSFESGRTDGEWVDMIAEGRVAWYSRPSRKRTRIASFEYSGAWNTTVPLQLRLGTDKVGLRGYDDSETSGGRRAVARLEERIIFPGIARYLGFGGAAFVDVGKMWAGDVPFGETVNPRVGAGLGLIFAVPRSSRQNLRLDVTAPLISDDGSHWGVSLTITSGRPRFYRGASDLARARSVAQTPAVFGWP